MTLRINPRPCSQADAEQNWNAIATLIPQMQAQIADAATVALPVGMIGHWMGAEADIPAGFALMDGVANAVGLGGTGYDLIDVFIKFGAIFDEHTAAANTGNASPAVTITGSTGSGSPGGSCTGTTDASSGNTGSASPTGSVSGTIDSASTGISLANASGNTGSNTTGISITDHGDHLHGVPNTVGVSTGGGTYAVANGSSGEVNSSGVTPIGSNVLSHAITDTGHTHSLGTHNHTITDPTHTHAMSGVSVTLSSHDHTVGSHTHTFTGTISVSGHTHGTGTLAGTCDAHAHTPGAPAHCTILPIERLDP